MKKIVFAYKHQYSYENGTKNNIKYEDNMINFDEISYKFLIDIEEQKYKDVNLEDLFLYQNVPIYYFERSSIFACIKNILIQLHIAEWIINIYGKNIDFETDNEILFDIMKSIFNINGCNLIKPTLVSNKRKVINTKLIGRYLIGLVYLCKSKINKNKNKKNILIISHAADINKLREINGKEYFDTQTGPIMEELKKKNNIINIQLLNSVDMIDKSLKYTHDFIPYEFIIIYKKLFQNRLLKNKKIIDKTEYLLNYDYSYKGYDLKNIIIKYAFCNIKNRYLMDFEEIVCAERILKKYHIDKCLVNGEADRIRSFIIGGNILGIKTFAVQHGIINQFSCGYTIHTKYSNYLVPYKTFLWGEKYSDLLNRYSNLYNPNNIEICGQVRTDLLKNYIDEKDSKDEFTILYATQYIEDLLKPATEMLFKALSNLDYSFVLNIKLHPADNNIDFYLSMIDKYGLKNVNLLKDCDLYDYISKSNLVVSVHSTVILEGALMNKPSVCIVLPKYNDLAGFVRDGVSLGATDVESLIESINKIKNKSVFGNYSYEEYIKNNFFIIDGNVTNRIVSFMGD